MPQAIVSPEELKKFASDLKRFNETLKSNSKIIETKLQQLGETWRDQEHKKFEHEFGQTIRVIKQFLDTSEQYIPFLNRKAQAAENYLKSR
ncbi:MAG: WXG100 family type VII secretion target [Desulfamplus sp.]|nr:WXG100 family type VII secretion target [Desulfamplus sp.]